MVFVLESRTVLTADQGDPFRSISFWSFVLFWLLIKLIRSGDRYRDVVDAIPFLPVEDDEMEAVRLVIAGILKPVTFMDREVIVHEGHAGHSLYLIRATSQFSRSDILRTSHTDSEILSYDCSWYSNLNAIIARSRYIIINGLVEVCVCGRACACVYLALVHMVTCTAGRR